MIPEHEILNKIKWDKKLTPSAYTIAYLDLRKLTSIPYAAIKHIEDGFMTIEKDGKDVAIPLHRIRTIRKNGEIIWQRK